MSVFARTLSASILLGAFVFGSAGDASESQENSENQQTFEKIAEKLQESKRGVLEAETQKRKILGSLYGINQRMKKISVDKGSLTNDLIQVQDNVKRIAKVIASLEAQISKQRVLLRRRLRALYKLSGESYVGILVSRSGSADFDETLKFLRIVTENDYRLIQNYKENVADYQAQKNRLRGQIQRLVAVEKNIKKQELLLAAEHQAKSKIVSELDREKIENMNRIKTLRDAGKGLGETSVNLSDLLKPSIYEQKGQLAPPILGTVVQEFGLLDDDKYKIRLSHKGWRYAASRSAPVTAIYDGKVIHSGAVPGYGHTVVVDHGDHYYSVYSRVSRPKVRVGEVLKRGEVFAEAGPPVGDYSDGIYFEIRHFSEPENPTNWISKQYLKQASIDQKDNI